MLNLKLLYLLPPANEVCEGYVFTPVCQSFCSWGGMHGGGCAWQGGMHGGGVCVVGDMHGRGTCVAGGHAWQGACMPCTPPTL